MQNVIVYNRIYYWEKNGILVVMSRAQMWCERDLDSSLDENPIQTQTPTKMTKVLFILKKIKKANVEHLKVDSKETKWNGAKVKI